MKFVVSQEEINIIIYFVKTYCISLLTYYIAIKSMDIHRKNKYKDYFISIALIFYVNYFYNR